jgi:hypothetical protein
MTETVSSLPEPNIFTPKVFNVPVEHYLDKSRAVPCIYLNNQLLLKFYSFWRKDSIFQEIEKSKADNLCLYLSTI